MKVFEILLNDLTPFTEEQLESRLRKFNWAYEFSDSMSEAAMAAKELQLLENMLYQMWKAQPEKAIALWWKYADPAPQDPTVVPSFIYRLQAQEK